MRTSAYGVVPGLPAPAGLYGPAASVPARKRPAVREGGWWVGIGSIGPDDAAVQIHHSFTASVSEQHTKQTGNLWKHKGGGRGSEKSVLAEQYTHKECTGRPHGHRV